MNNVNQNKMIEYGDPDSYEDRSRDQNQNNHYVQQFQEYRHHANHNQVGKIMGTGIQNQNFVSPPLPLYRFVKNDANTDSYLTPKTIHGEKIKSILNVVNVVSDQKIEKDALYDPLHSKRLSKWFAARSYKETNIKQMESFQIDHLLKPDANTNANNIKPEILEYIIYESLFHIETINEREKRNSARQNEEQIINNKFNINSEIFLSETNSNETVDLLQNNNAATNNDNTFTDNSNNRKGINRLQSTYSPSLVENFTPSLTFDGEFESGNLEKVMRVLGRQTLMTPKTLEFVHDYAAPSPVDHEYDLVLRNDISTNGNIQWYYFSVSTSKLLNSLDSTTIGSTNDYQLNSTSIHKNYSFPMRVRFNIINFQKKDSLYNYGMKPACLSEYEMKHHQRDWYHAGEDICYYRNGITYANKTKKPYPNGKKKKAIRYSYTLTFTYTFQRPDTVYFAHTFPYTYTDLQLYLKSLELDTTLSNIFHRRTLCETLVSNRCDVITITERAEAVVEDKNKPAIIISARVHPGESNSSFVMHGFINFLLSNAIEAQKLRKSFVFNIVPMLNPDGVIHGNYRCSLAGTDLNRRYWDAHQGLHPTIHAFKSLVQTVAVNRGVLLFLDLHGHSRQKNSFVYGCDLILQPERVTRFIQDSNSQEVISSNRIFSRIFPRILCSYSDSKNGGYFSYKDCSFGIDRSKYGTGRVVSWREFSIAGSYTIEMSFCGNGDNAEAGLLRKSFSTNMNSKNSKSAENLVQDGINHANGIAFQQSNQSKNAGGQSGIDSNFGGVYKAKTTTQSSMARVNEDSKESDRESDVSSLNGIDTKSGKVNYQVQLNTILDGYKQAYHYSKSDLHEAGKHIALAIYHFTNLPYSDVQTEIQMATQNDLLSKRGIVSLDSEVSTSQSNANENELNELKAKGKKTESATTATNGTSSSKKKSKKNKKVATSNNDDTNRSNHSTEINNINLPRSDLIVTNTSTVNSITTWSPVSNSLLPPLKPGNEQELNKRPNGLIYDKNGKKPLDEDFDLEFQAIEIKSTADENLEIRDDLDLDDNDADDIDECNEDDDDEDDAASEVSAMQSNQTLDHHNVSDKSLNTDINPEKLEQIYIRPTTSGVKRGKNVMSSAFYDNIIETTKRQPKVEFFNADMVTRSHLRNGVYSVEALSGLISRYQEEFFHEINSTGSGNYANTIAMHPCKHIGLRQQAELTIRKMLSIEGDLCISAGSNSSLSVLVKQEDECSNDEGEGSESDPSADNIPVTRMLKDLNKYKDTKSLVAALKKAAKLKRKKELEKNKKAEKKRIKQREKQMEEARIALAEAAAEAEAAAAAQRLAEQEKIRQQIVIESLENASVRKKVNSLYTTHHPLPKFIPTYKLAQEERTPMPLQIKLVNFKDFEDAKVLSHLTNGATVSSMNHFESNQAVYPNASDIPYPINTSSNRMNNNSFSMYSTYHTSHTSAAQSSSRGNNPVTETVHEPTPSTATNGKVIKNRTTTSASAQTTPNETVTTSTSPTFATSRRTIHHTRQKSLSDLPSTTSPTHNIDQPIQHSKYILDAEYMNGNSPINSSNSSSKNSHRNKLLHQFPAQLPKSLEEYFESINTESFKRRQNSFIFARTVAIDPRPSISTSISRSPTMSTVGNSNTPTQTQVDNKVSNISNHAET